MFYKLKRHNLPLEYICQPKKNPSKTTAIHPKTGIMQARNNWNENYLESLENQFVAMSQKGAVLFFEETVISQLYDYLLAQGKFGLARELAAWSITLHPFSAQFHFMKAKVEYMETLHSQAFLSLDQALLLDPTHTDSLLLQAKILTEMGRFEQAQSLLEELAQTQGMEHPEDISNIHLCFADLYEELDLHEELFESLKLALMTDPDNDSILDRLDLCTEFGQKHYEHIELLDQYLHERPYSSVAWFHIGHSYWHTEQLPLAADAFEFAFITDKHFEQAYLDFAEVCILMQNYSRALRHIGDALAIWPSDASMLTCKGNCHYWMGQYEKAIKAYRKAVRQNPKHSEGHYGLGRCCLQLKQPFAAMHAFRQALELDDRREEYAAALGEAHYQIGDKEAAAAAFDQATVLAPESSQYWVLNIAFLLRENYLEAANESIQSALANSYGAELLYCNVAYHFKIGAHEEAMLLLEEALLEDPNQLSTLWRVYPELEANLEVQRVING